MEVFGIQGHTLQQEFARTDGAESERSGKKYILFYEDWVELSSYGELIFDRRQFIRNFTEADEKYFAGRPTVVDHYRVYQ